MRRLIATATGTLLLSGLLTSPGQADSCGTYDRKGCAPASRRVDLDAPRFSTPTQVTNPLFPVSQLHSVVLLGHVEGKRFRTETTLLPTTGTVTFAGQTFAVLQSQYLAWSGRRLEEAAIDWYAQADDGSVWYLGEDVFDYSRGTVSATEGTWRAGRDGPGAMIMPADPQAGDVYRPENIPGVVFEEVTALGTTTVRGPLGPVAGALRVSELHQDGSHETKLFAPGYGEFKTAGDGDLEALATAVPADAAGQALPSALRSMATLSEGIVEASRLGEWAGARSSLRRLSARWRAVKALRQPWRVADLLEADLALLRTAVRRHRGALVGQRAVDVWQSVLDLQLRYRPVTEVDLARMHLWTQQLRLFAARGDRAAVLASVATLEWMRDRVTAALDADSLAVVDSWLDRIRRAADGGSLAAAADRAARLGAVLR